MNKSEYPAGWQFPEETEAKMQADLRRMQEEARRTAGILPLGVLALLIGLAVVVAWACVGGR